MKIVANDCVYIQKMDLDFIMKQEKIKPVSILNIYKNLKSKNGFIFIKFVNSCDINFLNKINYVFDYNTINGWTIKDIYLLYIDYFEKKESLLKLIEFTPKSNSCLREKMIRDLDVLRFSLKSLLYVLLFKYKILKSWLPVELDLSECFFKQETVFNKLFKKNL